MSTLTCKWCGREFEKGHGFGFVEWYCSQKCFEEAKQNEENKKLREQEEAIRHQEMLDAQARSLGYRNHAHYVAAQKQAVIDEVDEVANDIVARGNAISNEYDEITKHKGHMTIKDLALTFKSVSGNFPGKDFCDRDYNFVGIGSDAQVYCVEGISSEKAKKLLASFKNLASRYSTTHEIERKNKYVKVSQKVTATSSISITSRDVATYLLSKKDGIEDTIAPLLKRAEKTNIRNEAKNFFIMSCVSIICFLISTIVYKPINNGGASFWGFLFSFAAFATTVLSGGYRKNNIFSLVGTVLLPIVLTIIYLFVPGEINTPSGYIESKTLLLQGPLFIGTIFSGENPPFTLFVDELTIFASLLAIIPAAKNYKTKLWDLNTNLKEDDLNYLSLDNLTGKYSTITLMIPILLLSVALVFTLGWEYIDTDSYEGLNIGNFFWATIFIIPSYLALFYTPSKSIRFRPSFFIIEAVLIFTFALWAILFFAQSTGGFTFLGILCIIFAVGMTIKTVIEIKKRIFPSKKSVNLSKR